MNLAYLELRYSGGSANADPNASLGGVMSSVALRSRAITAATPISGVTLLDAPGVPVGSGSINFTKSTNQLTWTGPSGTAGLPIAVAADGRFILTDSIGQKLHIEVDFETLPIDDATSTLTLAAIPNSLFDNISKIESYYGESEHRCLYIANTHPIDGFYGVKSYISIDATGADSLQIGMEGTATTTAQTIANENVAPTGITFSAPSDYIAGLLSNQILPGQAQPLWVKRTVPANVTTPTANDTATLAFRAGY